MYRSPGRIVEAYIDPFEALTETGELVVIVQNLGTISASYQVPHVLNVLTYTVHVWILGCIEFNPPTTVLKAGCHVVCVLICLMKNDHRPG